MQQIKFVAEFEISLIMPILQYKDDTQLNVINNQSQRVMHLMGKLCHAIIEEKASQNKRYMLN